MGFCAVPQSTQWVLTREPDFAVGWLWATVNGMPELHGRCFAACDVMRRARPLTYVFQLAKRTEVGWLAGFPGFQRRLWGAAQVRTCVLSLLSCR